MNFLIHVWRPVVEIALLAILFYSVLAFMKATPAYRLLRGLVILTVVFIVAFFVLQILNFDVINWILTKFFTFSVIAFLIIFQPELRHGLAQIGQRRLSGIFLKEEQVIDEIVKAVDTLSSRKIGAILALERKMNLKVYIETGVIMDSHISAELLHTIFMPNSPLHDGGVVIRGDRIVASCVLFPLTENPSISKTLGTRHRAALGLTEETDALAIVVSEETGTISVATEGKLTRDLELEMLKNKLNELYQPVSTRKYFFTFGRKSEA